MRQQALHHKRIIGAAAAAVLCAYGTAAMAQAWPAKNITIVVPFATGGTTDAIARSLGQALSKSLGKPVIVENKPGAGATIGADYVAKAKPDGHTLLLGAVHHTIASSVYKKLPYDFQRDFAPVTTVALVPNVLVVNANVPAKNVAELIALAKKSPGKLTFGSNGNGTGQHLIGAQFGIASGVDIMHVPYKGSGPLTIDLLGGQIDMSFDTVTPVLSHIRAGKLRALAVTTIARSAALPDVPTLDEAGLKGFDQGTWFGVLAPAAAPKEVVARLNAEIVKIVNAPDFRKRMDELGAIPIGNSTAQMASQIRTDTERYAKVVKAAKVAVE
ncbi:MULTISPECIES: tripartite tricarboxylate transporter substrate binding protein [unclassified Massilia]|uniref:Bug family tripartite tricarboxylate transporter substrate binding protein n=1 Tax=unclassified Massilia TaxID=2609279 RepID=UPI00177B6C4D|nr:tripartite tricarboxylate transporter substrate binding protein [Massilia sp. CFBP 13647]MBD8672141.1 tripartite tricarboxylate transporter substrate binding protein [Massilia sp. CFBP 13721]